MAREAVALKARWFFVFFCVSGFCSLVYEVVWLRLAMAEYGVTTPLVSIVLSVFMAGLALGSWGAGRLARRLEGHATALVRLYAAAELAIAASAAVVPGVLAAGRTLLARAGVGEWGSAGYYGASASWVTLALLPFCVCMGATFPLAMGAIRSEAPEGSARSFSYLYVANVVGATAGTLASAFVLIELLGFRGTLVFTAGLNAMLAVAAFLLNLRPSPSPAAPRAAEEAAPGRVGRRDSLDGPRLLWALFATGLVSMAMEVVWVRLFTPYLGTVVYSFATILALYLGATLAGSRIYRARVRHGGASLGPGLWGGIAVASLLPLVFADPRWATATMTGGVLRAAAGIVPFCAGLGFATPLLVDRWAAGEPQRAGAGYAVNVVGCIVGPLVAGFGLLPAVGERTVLLLLSLPLIMLGAVAGAPTGGSAPARRRAWMALALATAVSALIFAVGRTFESQFPRSVVRRDSTATVTAWGRGRSKRLLVNGVGMTVLVPLTKLMAHLPLAFHAEPPRRALTICFGMGTSFRSTLSWGVEGTAVELVPSVPTLFGYFHGDGPQLLASPQARVVIDDGRRFLERSRESFDVIVIDPPPPVEAAGSSLLYSREFYEALKPRLAPHGIVQQWIPGGEDLTVVSFTRAIRESFPYVRGFVSIQGWGLHLLASREPIPATTAAVLAGRLPLAAERDLVEWGPGATAVEQFERALRNEIDPERVISRVPGAGSLHDDRPINEYYFLRRARARREEAGLFVPARGELLAPPRNGGVCRPAPPSANLSFRPYRPPRERKSMATALAETSLQDTTLEPIRDKVTAGERLSFADGVTLYRSHDLLAIGHLANQVRERRHGDAAYFVRNTHINHTNVCAATCDFCAFAAKKGEPRAYTLGLDDIFRTVAGLPKAVREVHIVGGLHPDLPWSYFTDMMRGIKQARPDIHVKAFTAVEVFFFHKLYRMSVERVLAELKEAGLDSMPGGGAEIFAKETRDKIVRGKADAGQWLDVMRQAHRQGIPTNATMLYGHIESVEDRVDHLARLRELQDETGGFVTYIPLAFQPWEAPAMDCPETTAFEDLKAIAVGRLMLDNFPHVKSYWIMIGPRLAQVGLSFGADDIDGTVTEEKIAHDAGAKTPQILTVHELVRLIREAGRRPIERDTVFNVVKAW